MNRLCLITVVLFVLSNDIVAQKQKVQKPVTQVKTATSKKPDSTPVTAVSDPAQDEKKIKDMMAFLGFMLNTLGSSNTSPRDKDVVITESYSKIFRDAKVQVEDDLDEKRSVITNKDVVAYLKDINFFFKEVKFEFTIDKIERGENTTKDIFYKVSLHRNLSGVTSDGKTVNNITPRFVEINFNPKEQDLKIVSIYTKEIDEKEALQNWWKQLSLEWQSIFRKKFNFPDSVQLSDIRRVTSLDELNLANNKYIQSFEPLAQMKSLKVLNLSNTSINDLSPVRNLTDLTELNLSHTPINDLTPLRYSNNLLKLDINNTSVKDISVVQRMPKLQYVDASATDIVDFSFLGNLTDLILLNLSNTKLSDLSWSEGNSKVVDLNISKTQVQDLSPVKKLQNLKTLICDSTRIHDVSPLANLENLKVLQANATLISDLQPLQKLARLEKIYCDQTPIKKNMAETFMAAHPKTLVVYDSHDLKAWWDSLSGEWKMVIEMAAKINGNPAKEELARVGNIDSINFSGTRITDLEPLRKFQKLRVIIANKTLIKDLTPIKDHREISYLNVSETNVTDLSPLSQLSKLRLLKADQCKILSIEPLQKNKALEKIYVEGTTINDINAREFLHANSKCLLIYKTVHLSRWWRNLSENWKEIFLAQLKDTTRESLHGLVEQETFHFQDSPITDLSGLSEFVRLKELHFSGTSMTEIAPLDNLKSLRSLHASHSPIQNIESLSQLGELRELDISNTPIEDLTPLWTLQNLRSLNCAGTQIKRLDALEKLESLEYLDCSNTNVSKLTPLDYLHLKTFKCYNTRVSTRTIENFVASHSDCKVIYYR